MVEDDKSRTQLRGRMRREALISAARALLRERPIREVTLADIAAHAGIPASSAYHFFPDVQGVYQALVGVLEGELVAWHEQLRDCNDPRWQDVVARYLTHGAEFFRANRCATQLMLGPYSPPAIKLSDRDNDYELAMHLLHLVGEHFVVPEMPHLPDVFFHAIEIADVFFGLSVIRFDAITPDYSLEATRAALAYLEIYLPPVLLRRGAGSALVSGGPPEFSRSAGQVPHPED